MRPYASSSSVFGDPWDVVDRLVDDVERRARHATSAEDFWPWVLATTVEALAARGGTAWHVCGAEGLRPWSVAGSAADESSSNLTTRRSAPAAAAAASRRGCILLPDAAPPDDSEAINPTTDTLVLAPVVVDGAAVAVLELALRADAPPDARDGTLRVLETLAESAAAFHREMLRRSSAVEVAALRRVDEWLAVLYRAHDVTSAAYALANEGRRQLDCDRLSVVVTARGRVGATAVSGADVIDRTSPQVQALERAARQSSAEQALAEYRAVSPACDVGFIPLAAEHESAAAAYLRCLLVAENFTAPLAAHFEALLEPLRRHAPSALAAAAARQSAGVAERSVFGRLRRTLERISRRPLLLATIAALAVAPLLIPADLTVEARGQWQPRDRRDLYAPLDAVVQEVRVAHGDAVAPGDVLVVLRSPELEVELSRVLGEIETARSRLSALRSLRTSAAGPTSSGAARQQELTAEEEQLKQTLASREAELALLRARQAELQVRAPIAGLALTWNAERQLVGRPVARGQLLLHTADVAGPWVVDLDVPQRRLVDLLEARALQPEPLVATFVTATEPELRRQARLERIAESVEVNEAGEVVVPAVLAGDDEYLNSHTPHPGTSVTATIVCRRTTLGVVWWRELVRFVYDRRL